MMKHRVWGAVALLPICVALLSCERAAPTAETTAPLVAHAAYTGGELRTTMQHYTAGVQARNDGDLIAAKRHVLEALGTSPQHPALVYMMASIEAKTGQCDTSLRWLDRCAELGAAADLQSDDSFAACAEHEGFGEIAARLASNGAAQPAAEIVATLDDAGLWPEGVAYDPVTGDLFLGSMSENRIVAIRSDGTVEGFGSSAEDGLWPILGMTVDAERRQLWACMGSGSDELVTEGERRFNGVVRYGLDSGQLLARYELADDGVNRLLNDVVVAGDGTAYISESNHGSAYRITPDGDALEHFRHFPKLNYLNGIALSSDDRILYLAAVEGIHAFILDEERLLPLQTSRDLSTVSADGLCRAGSSLIAVQNQPRLNFRVMRFELDETGLAIRAANLLPAGLPEGLIPYTCAVGSDEVFVNGTGPLNLMDGDELPANPVVVRLPL